MNGGKDALFSLIVPTLNRREEVSRLLASIEHQTCRDFEVIIVDQNPNDVLDGICADFALRMPLLHLKTESKGAARARNYGLGFSKGTLINFPDDDCEFSPGLLDAVAQRLDAKEGLDAVFVRAVDPISREGKVSRFRCEGQWVTPINVFSTTIEFTMFIKASALAEIGPQDEKLGVGTFYGAEEGSDFVLRGLAMKKRFYFEPSLLIYHVQKNERNDAERFGAAEQKRAYNYGKGFGRLMVKHVVIYRNRGMALRFLYFQIRAFCAAILYLVTLKRDRSNFYWRTFQGRLVGAWCSSIDFWKARKERKPQA